MDSSLQKSSEPVGVIILMEMLLDSRYFCLKWGQWADLLWVAGLGGSRMPPPAPSLQIPTWGSCPGCCQVLRCVEGPGHESCLSPALPSPSPRHRTSSPGQPAYASVTCSPEHYSAQKIAFSKDWLFLFRVVIFHEVKVTSGVVFENCTCSY